MPKCPNQKAYPEPELEKTKETKPYRPAFVPLSISARSQPRSSGASRASAERAAGQRNMVIGGLSWGGGILITAITYSAAASSPGGGSFVIAWGAILFGALQFFKGLAQAK